MGWLHGNTERKVTKEEIEEIEKRKKDSQKYWEEVSKTRIERLQKKINSDLSSVSITLDTMTPDEWEHNRNDYPQGSLREFLHDCKICHEEDNKILEETKTFLSKQKTDKEIIKYFFETDGSTKETYDVLINSK